jgi:hypothetical protein
MRPRTVPDRSDGIRAKQPVRANRGERADRRSAARSVASTGFGSRSGSRSVRQHTPVHTRGMPDTSSDRSTSAPTTPPGGTLDSCCGTTLIARMRAQHITGRVTATTAARTRQDRDLVTDFGFQHGSSGHSGGKSRPDGLAASTLRELPATTFTFAGEPRKIGVHGGQLKCRPH